MNKLIFLLIALLLLVTGCATTIDSTPAPNANANPNATAMPIAPAAVAPSPTVVLRATGNCQSRISGRVLDPSGKPVKAATVQLRASVIKGTPPRTVSDDNGLYGFAGLCAGSYGFTVAMPGKQAQPVTPTANVDGANATRLDLALK